MIQAGFDIHNMFVDIWKTFAVVEKWKMKILGAHVAKIIGNSTSDPFFSKNS